MATGTSHRVVPKPFPMGGSLWGIPRPLVYGKSKSKMDGLGVAPWIGHPYKWDYIDGYKWYLLRLLFMILVINIIGCTYSCGIG